MKKRTQLGRPGPKRISMTEGWGEEAMVEGGRGSGGKQQPKE